MPVGRSRRELRAPSAPHRRGRSPTCGMLAGFEHARVPAGEPPSSTAASRDRRGPAAAGVRPRSRHGDRRPLRLVVTACADRAAAELAHGGTWTPSCWAQPARPPPIRPDAERCPADCSGRRGAGASLGEDGESLPRLRRRPQPSGRVEPERSRRHGCAVMPDCERCREREGSLSLQGGMGERCHSDGNPADLRGFRHRLPLNDPASAGIAHVTIRGM